MNKKLQWSIEQYLNKWVYQKNNNFIKYYRNLFNWLLQKIIVWK